MEKIILIITVCMIIMAAPIISKMIKTPVVVIEITLGLLCGYLGLIYSDETLKLVAKFGFVYLMFLAGLEINFKLVKIIKATLAVNVILYFILLYTISGLVCWLFGLGLTYFVALPIFSLGMIMMLLKEYGKEQPWLNLALSIGVVGEIISILALTLFSGWTEYGFTSNFFYSILTIALVIVAIILLLRVSYVLFWWFPEIRNFIIPENQDDKHDQDIRFSLSLLLIFVSIMLILKIDVVLGAFTTGLFFKMFFNQKHELLEKIESFGYGFFAPIFFIYTGSTVKLDMVTLEILHHAIFIMCAIITIRLISSYLVFYNYLKFKQTMLFALSDSMPLTFMVAIAMLSYNYGLISQDEYFSFIIASIIDGLFLMILIRKLYKYFIPHT
ncbi:probable sodium/hydrogen antiporter [Aliarcobacter butzleri RM4018]|uniref:Probable sodium/hydrogen antiporter n=1 Tax=Aliarcobacter butzleri (strain RM4018) TaxID=367737 RepID=A8ESA7_ALIB4|nr:cation:proton antiporter [Aliarcobacter butzleri]ABV66831.1 probable sodium/hydrogen antiporter [Aliarcobacter butzleri RM4018]MDN5055072.1 cation:proton antiporter [Aliarcobacter butzleri]GGT68818.1 sodium:proton antiporter [Aliarcobacter butzleri]SNV25499.1 transporter, monovalent cation:proton antiporter-2 (CPA2) family [Aliarcobacter butzleri]